MAGGCERHRAVGVDQHVDDRGEQPLGAVVRARHLVVERREDGGRVRVHGHQRAPAEAQAGRVRRGRRAVAGHVPHHHRQPPIGQHHRVVEVPAHQQGLLGRPVAGGQPQAPRAGQALGQQTLLDGLPQLALGLLGGLAAGRRRHRLALALHLALHEVEPLHQLGQLAHGVLAGRDRVGQAPPRHAPDARAEQGHRPAHPPPELAAGHRHHQQGEHRRGHDGREGDLPAPVAGGQGGQALALDLLEQPRLLGAEAVEARLAEPLVDAPLRLAAAPLAPEPDELDGLLEPQRGGAVDRLGGRLQVRVAVQQRLQVPDPARIALAGDQVLAQVVAARQQDVGPVGALGGQQVDQELVGGRLARERPFGAVAVVARRADDADDGDRDQHPQHHGQPRDEGGQRAAQRSRAASLGQPHADEPWSGRRRERGARGRRAGWCTRLRRAGPPPRGA